jgi:hypothetical protein
VLVGQNPPEGCPQHDRYDQKTLPNEKPNRVSDHDSAPEPWLVEASGG